MLRKAAVSKRICDRRRAQNADWSYVKKKYKLNVTNFLCSEGIVKFFV